MSDGETGQQGVGDLRLSARDGALLLHLAGEAAAIGAWSCTLPSGALRLDEHAARLLGLAGDRLALGDLLGALTPDYRDAIGRAVARVQHSGGFSLEARLGPSATREPIPVRLTARVVPGEEGGAARLLGIVAPLRGRRDPAAEATHLAAIVASSDDAIISKTLEGVVTSWNRSAERLFGYTAAEMLGQSITRLAPPGYEDDMPGILARIRAGGRVDHYETWRRHKDGTLVRVSLTVSPIHDATGALVGASKVARDITAAHRAADALRGAEARLAAAEEELVQVSRLGALGQMAAMFAHELNQPITAIISYAAAGRRLLAKGGDPALQRASQAFERGADQARRVGQIIHTLRAFAEGAAAERKPEPLATIIEEAVRLVAGTVQARGVRVQLDLDPACPLVMADRLLIRQVLLNLMRNAADAMERVARREMVVSTRLRQDVVELAVADTGSGLAPEVAERLFQPFVTTKPGGAGGGLSICRSIVEAHGGHLWTEQNPAGGTTFRFTLQCVAE